MSIMHYRINGVHMNDDIIYALYQILIVALE